MILDTIENKIPPFVTDEMIIMSGTYSQIYIQYLFAVKGKQNLLKKPWRDEVFKYISGIIKAKNQKPIIVNGVEDHVHVFVGLKPSMCISDLVRDIKNNSSKFINEQKYLPVKFAWQEGYGVFSYSHSHIDNVYQYIVNQESHHKKITFKEEYLSFLKKFEVDYNEKYLFDWLED
jgi:putative transposase